MSEIKKIAEQRRIARILCQDEKGKCLHNATSCESHIECAFTIWAQKLLNVGYGDVKQAVREFAEKVKQFLDGAEIYFYNGEEEGIWDSGAVAEQIDKLVKEVCGE